MRILAIAALLALASPAFSQQQPPDASQTIALQIGQLVMANAQLVAQNASLQSRVDDLTKKLAAVPAQAPDQAPIPAPRDQ